MTSRLFMGAVVVWIGAASSSFASQAAAPAKGSQPALSMTCNAQAGSFHVSVANPGSGDLAVLLGYTPGSPQPQIVTALAVHVIRPATGATEEYVYINPKYATYAGRMDPWIVPLKPGGTFDVDVSVKDFISTMSFNPLDLSVANGGQLILEGRAIPKQPAKVWTGTAEAQIEGCR